MAWGLLYSLRTAEQEATMTRRTALIIAAALASLTALPAVASANPRRAPIMRVQGESADSYARRAEAAMAVAKSRIQSKAERTRMTAQERAKLGNDLNAAIQVLRDRIAQRGHDGWISSQENQDIQTLHTAIRAELSKSHGSFDSWQLL
jgi:hypothetical protein